MRKLRGLPVQVGGFGRLLSESVARWLPLRVVPDHIPGAQLADPRLNLGKVSHNQPDELLGAQRAAFDAAMTTG
jgi:hypothetical protein